MRLSLACINNSNLLHLLPCSNSSSITQISLLTHLRSFDLHLSSLVDSNPKTIEALRSYLLDVDLLVLLLRYSLLCQ